MCKLRLTIDWLSELLYVSAGFATPSSILQGSGYQIPPKNLYSGSQGYEPTISSQLPPPGMSNFFSDIDIFLVLKWLVIFPCLPLPHAQAYSI